MMRTTLIGLVLVPLVFATSVLGAKNVFCYYGSWASTRNGGGKFTVDNIDPFLCTHVVYAFAGINTDGTIRVIVDNSQTTETVLGDMRRLTNLTKVNPNLKTLLAVGGYAEGSPKFSVVAKDSTLRTKFAKNAADFCQAQGFNGLDLDWEYPAQLGGDSSVDKANYVSFLQVLKNELSSRGMLLTIAVAAAEFSASISYNIPEVSKYVDFINLMTYDFHNYQDGFTGHNAPLNAGLYDTSFQKQLNVKSSITYWLQQGAPASKIHLGMPFYGQSYTLKSTSSYGVGADTSGAGLAGPYISGAGVLGYNEICEKITIYKWNQAWDSVQQAAYAYSGNQWVGYDSTNSISLKCDLINQLGLAGGMMWTIEMDDFNGNCGVKFPLLNTMRNKLGLSGVSTTTVVPTTTSTKAPAPVTTTTSTTTKVPTTTAAPVTTTVKTTTSTTTTKAPTTTTAVPSGTFKCSSAVGYFRDPVNCAKFYYCDGVRQYDYVCPAGLYYDLTISVCNWANSVKC